MGELNKTIHCLFCRAVILFGGLPAERYQDHFLKEHNILTYDTTKLVLETLAEEWPEHFGKKDFGQQTEVLGVTNVGVQVDALTEITLAGIDDRSDSYNTEVESYFSDEDSRDIGPSIEASFLADSKQAQETRQEEHGSGNWTCCIPEKVEEKSIKTTVNVGKRILRSKKRDIIKDELCLLSTPNSESEELNSDSCSSITETHINNACKLLESIWECKEADCLRINEEDSFGNKSFFNCKMCNTRFLTGVRESHLKLQHNISYGDYKNRFGDTNEIILHSCYLCKQEVFWDRISVQKHLSSHNKTLPDYIKKYRTQLCDSPHMIKDEESEIAWYNKHGIACAVCSSVFSCKSNCDRHIQAKHDITGPEYAKMYGDHKQSEQFSCEICDATFPWVKKLIKNHLEGNHFLSLEKYGELYIDKGKSLKRKAGSDVDLSNMINCRIMCKKLNPNFLKIRYKSESGESEDEDFDYSGLSKVELGKCVDNIIEEMFDVEPKLFKSDNKSPIITALLLESVHGEFVKNHKNSNCTAPEYGSENIITDSTENDMLNDDDLTDGLSTITSQECQDEIFNEEPTSDFEDIDNLLSDDEDNSGKQLETNKQNTSSSISESCNVNPKPELINKHEGKCEPHITWANGSKYSCKVCNGPEMSSCNDFIQHIQDHAYSGLLEYKERFGDIFSEVSYTICYICGEKLVQDYVDILDHLKKHHKEHSVKSYYEEFINDSTPFEPQLFDLSQCISDSSLGFEPIASTSNDTHVIHDMDFNIYESFDFDKYLHWVNKCTILCKEKSCVFSSKILETFQQHTLQAHKQTYQEYCQLYNIDPFNPWVRTIFTVCKICATAVRNNKDEVERHMKANHNISGLIYYLENIGTSNKDTKNISTSDILNEKLDAALQDINNQNDYEESDESDLEILVDTWERKKRCIEVTETESIVMDVKVDM